MSGDSGAALQEISDAAMRLADMLAAYVSQHGASLPNTAAVLEEKRKWLVRNLYAHPEEDVRAEGKE